MSAPGQSRYSSRSRSRQVKRETSPLPFLPQVESLILPDGAVSEEAAELLNEFVHPHHHHEADATVVGGESPLDDDPIFADESDKPKTKWWKRPSPYWILGVMPFTSIASSLVIAPRIEIYTILACSVHKPDIFKQSFPDYELGIQNLNLSHREASSNVDSILPSASSVRDTFSLPLIPVYFPEHPPSFESPESGNGTVPPSSPRNQCAADPVVQAAVAKLIAVIAAFTGILSCITTGWWGSFSDRHGRTRVMGISILGVFLSDINFILVSSFPKIFPGGYWFLVVASVIDGFLGGHSTGVAAIHGYLADTSTESSRSRIFSMSLGLMFIGFAIGPSLGSLIIRLTGKTLSVFFFASALHAIYTIFVWTILPESLTQKKRQLAKEKYEADLLDSANERRQNPAVGYLVTIRRLFAFLSPLTMFMPEEEKIRSSLLKKAKKDYNLTLMALTYALTSSLMGSYSYKFQYAASAFGWTSETLGYFLSLVGAVRAVFLAAILPVVIKLFKPEPVTLELPITPRETTALLQGTEGGPQTPSSSVSRTQTRRTIKKEIHSPLFDLNLARASLVVEIVGYTFMGLAPSGTAFTLFALLVSLAAGFSPAIQSVTLVLYSRRGGTEIGRLFGALSVIQALCQILGPALFGFIYVNSVATHPRTIFFVTVGLVVASFLLLAFVRLPKTSEYRRGESIADVEEDFASHNTNHQHQHEATLVDEADDTDTDTITPNADRARKRHPPSRTALSYGSI